MSEMILIIAWSRVRFLKTTELKETETTMDLNVIKPNGRDFVRQFFLPDATSISFRFSFRVQIKHISTLFFILFFEIVNGHSSQRLAVRTFRSHFSNVLSLELDSLRAN